MDIPSSPAKAANESMFPNIHCLLRIICTLPVTSCECERSVRVLRRLKTYMGNNNGPRKIDWSCFAAHKLQP